MRAASRCTTTTCVITNRSWQPPTGQARARARSHKHKPGPMPTPTTQARAALRTNYDLDPRFTRMHAQANAQTNAPQPSQRW